MIAYAISKGEGTLIAYGLCSQFELYLTVQKAGIDAGDTNLTIITGPAHEFPGMGE